MDSLTIRRETDADIPDIDKIVTAAFGRPDEARIVDALRDDDALAVSLVAVVNTKIVGHVAASAVTFDDGTGGWFGVAPVAVAPEAQGQGVGTALMEHVVEALREGGAGGAVVLGDPRYYARFGFVQSEPLTFPGAPGDHFRALKLVDSRFPSGATRYHPAFY